MSSANLIKLRVVEETTIGTTPTNSADWLTLCYVDESLSATPNFDQSQRICGTTGASTRNPRSRSLASITAGGGVNGEMGYQPVFDLLLESVFSNDFSTNDLSVGQTPKAMTIEKEYGDLTNKFLHLTGAQVTQLAIAIPFGSKATWSATFDALTTDATASASLVGTGTVTGELSNKILSGARDFASLEFDDVAATASDYIITGLNLNITGNKRPINGLGSLSPQAHVDGDMSVTGDMTIYLTNGNYQRYLDALANTDVKLEFSLIDPDGKGYSFTLPKVNFDAPAPASPGRNQDVTLNLAFTSHTDSVVVTRAP